MVQHTKKKVWPVLDYQELNEYIACHTGGETTDMCLDTIHDWRQKQIASMIVDLKICRSANRVCTGPGNLEKSWKNSNCPKAPGVF